MAWKWILSLTVPIVFILILQYRFWFDDTGMVASWKLQQQMTELEQDISAQHVRNDWLKAEFKILSVFVIVVALLIFMFVAHATAYAFLAGALCSMSAGFFGMEAATRANVRTSNAANTDGMGAALVVAFDGGSVMGLSVASLGLVGVGVVFMLIDPSNMTNYQTLNGFGSPATGP